MVMGRPRAFDVNEALDRAMKVFWSKGYEGASLAELTRAMKINSPSLYAAFGSKEELFHAVLDRYWEWRSDFLSDALAAPTGREVIERFLRGSADLNTDPNAPPGCLLVLSGLSCGSAARTIPSELARRRAGMERAIRERLERAAAEGDLTPDADPAALAHYVVIVAIGFAVQAAAGATREDLRKVAELALRAVPAAAAKRRKFRRRSSGSERASAGAEY
jgi:AcrR family transcriptional regulator